MPEQRSNGGGTGRCSPGHARRSAARLALVVGAGSASHGAGRSRSAGRHPCLWSGRTLAHYRILDRLGAGGMGEVYLAEDTELGRRVALKVLPRELALHPERLARFQREARAIAALNHRNIVTIHSVETADGLHFFTMELVEGKTLDEVIPPDGLPLPALLKLAIPLAEALAAAHHGGVVHRDLKPGNVMVDRDGRLKVLDFGLASVTTRLEEPAVEAPQPEATAPIVAPGDLLTRDGGILGTIPYLSPEQVRGQPPDGRSDLFALGVVLYQMCTGRCPFPGETPAARIASLLRDTPPPVHEVRADLPADLARIVARCLEKDPQDRYPSALDVRDELRQLRDEVAASALRGELGRLRREFPSDSGADLPAPLVAPTGGKAATLRRVLLAAVALVPLVGGLGAALLAGNGAPAPPPAPRVASLVALPSRFVGPTAEGYLAEAVPRALSSALATVPGLTTKAPPTGAEAERLAGELARLAEAYAVPAVVVSSITVAADRVLLDVELVEAGSRDLLWSRQLVGRPGGELELAERAAGELCRWLRGTDAEPSRSPTAP